MGTVFDGVDFADMIEPISELDPDGWEKATPPGEVDVLTEEADHLRRYFMGLTSNPPKDHLRFGLIAKKVCDIIAQFLLAHFLHPCQGYEVRMRVLYLLSLHPEAYNVIRNLLEILEEGAKERMSDDILRGHGIDPEMSIDYDFYELYFNYQEYLKALLKFVRANQFNGGTPVEHRRYFLHTMTHEVSRLWI